MLIVCGRQGSHGSQCVKKILIYFTNNFRKAHQLVETEKSTKETEVEEHEVFRHTKTKKMPVLKNKSVSDTFDESNNSKNSDGNCLNFISFFLQIHIAYWYQYL